MKTLEKPQTLDQSTNPFAAKPNEDMEFLHNKQCSPNFSRQEGRGWLQSPSSLPAGHGLSETTRGRTWGAAGEFSVRWIQMGSGWIWKIYGLI